MAQCFQACEWSHVDLWYAYIDCLLKSPGSKASQKAEAVTIFSLKFWLEIRLGLAIFIFPIQVQSLEKGVSFPPNLVWDVRTKFSLAVSGDNGPHQNLEQNTLKLCRFHMKSDSLNLYQNMSNQCLVSLNWESLRGCCD